MSIVTVEIPVRVTREKTFGVDHEATQERSIKFVVEAEDEEEAVEIISLLLLNELEPDEADEVVQVLS